MLRLQLFDEIFFPLGISQIHHQTRKSYNGWTRTKMRQELGTQTKTRERERERARNLSTSGAHLSSKERGKKCLGFHQPSLLASNLFYHDSAFSRDWFSGEPIDDKWTTYEKPHLTATNRFHRSITYRPGWMQGCCIPIEFISTNTVGFMM